MNDLAHAAIRLASAILLGGAVTLLHRRCRQPGKSKTSLLQAQILLCLSGAMMMLLIEDSLARAFGIAGAASIVRFRTPVKDPKDAAVLFLLIGVGMACGLGSFVLAATAALFLSLFLLVSAQLSKPRLSPTGDSAASLQKLHASLLEEEGKEAGCPARNAETAA